MSKTVAQLAVQRNWRLLHKEEIAKYNQEYYAANREREILRVLVYHQEHPDKKRRRDRRYHQNHLEESADKTRKRRYAWELGDSYEAMLARQGGHCADCPATESMPGRRLAVDHDHGNGEVRGIVCHACNMKRG